MRRLLSLFLTSVAMALPMSGSAELVNFQRPGTGLFDDIDDATLQAEVTKQALAFLDTLHKHWGEGPERLRTAVYGDLERDEQGKLIYLRNINDHGVLEGYEFR